MVMKVKRFRGIWNMEAVCREGKLLCCLQWVGYALLELPSLKRFIGESLRRFSFHEHNTIKCVVYFPKKGYISPKQYPSVFPCLPNFVRMKPFPMFIYRIWR